MTVLGQSIGRRDAFAKVTGAARYARDAADPDAWHLKLVPAGRPHAKIVAIDTRRAEALPGVRAVLTAADVPVNRYGLIVADRPVLCGDKVRYVGDPVAAVVAETPELADQAADLVQVRYEDLPVLDAPLASLRPGAPLVHDDYPGNLAASYTMTVGDVGSALAQADVVVEREFRTPMQEHAYLEPEAGLGYIDEAGRVTVLTAGQSIFDDQRQIAAALGLAADQVRVIYPAIGGSFGGREDLSMQVALALAAWRLQHPVKLSWTRSESIIGHAKRHAMILRYKWGARRDGTLLAAQMEIISDAGAYCLSSSSVLDNFRYAAIGPYKIPNISLVARAVYTNNVPGGAFRGFGSPQLAFAAELALAHLAEATGVDPVTIRLRNCLNDDDLLATGSPVPGGVSLPELIAGCARTIGAEETASGWVMPPPVTLADGRRRAWGLAVGMKSCGFGFGFHEGAEARVVLDGAAEVEKATVFCGAADVGQGAHSALLQLCAEVLQVPTDRVDVAPSDTATTPDAGPASASRLSIMAGNAVRRASELALVDWRNESRPAVGQVRWDAPETTAPDPVTGACKNSISFSYAAHAAEVDVDTSTGQVALHRVVAAHDPGKAINPQQVEGQVHGAVVQAQGWTLIENFITRGGRVYTDRLSTYLIPTIADIPDEFDTVLIEKPDPVGPFGVRGIGEIPFIPLAPAVVAGVHAAIGLWFDELPLVPERVWRRLRDRGV